MPKVVGVKFKKSCRVYYFEAGDFEYSENVPVIVETARGTEMGFVSMLPTDMDEDKIVAPLKPVVRLATKKDIDQIEKLAQKREEALKVSAQKIAESELDMKLTDCEYTFDGSKLIIYFTADGRVDFRDLVKDLASAFHVRIELRQIGARDECKMLGGLGPCGRVCCCANHMPDYAHVTIKMAKNQGLSLNPTKISGLCGRLMCCLSYENEVYTELNKILPAVGEYIKASGGREGVVVSLNQLKSSVRIKMQDGDKVSFADVELKDIGAENAEQPYSLRSASDKEDDVPEIFEEDIGLEVKIEQNGSKTELSDNKQKQNDKRDKKFKKKKNKDNNPNKQNSQNGQPNPHSQNKDNRNGEQTNKDNRNNGQKNRDERRDKNRNDSDNRKPDNAKGGNPETNKDNKPKQNGNAENEQAKDKPFHKRKKKRFHKNGNQTAAPSEPKAEA
ncbi:MAG: hypothetical protein J6C23_08490 [Clostridia bacterium]|nr:hypothetical protein [Clostridia bacterium]